jgi:hypothetical protein
MRVLSEAAFIRRGVAQSCTLLYRGFAARRRHDDPAVCRLQVGDTADWKSALRSTGISNRVRLPLACLLSCLLLALPAAAHIGSPSVIYETPAPPVPMRVIIRPPGVVPGLADIDVRVLTNGVKRVTVLPVHWRAGVQGSPPPDVAEPVEGESGLYHAQLWLMARGAYSVHVNVETANGAAKVIVPVNSLATTRLPMSGALGGILVVLGVLLFTLAATIVGAAVRESVLAPGLQPTSRRLWAGRAAIAFAALGLSVALVGGRSWWNAKDSDYRNNRMHKPAECVADVRVDGGQRIARLTILTNETRAAWSGLVPDHGKLMHVFMVREPALDVLAHVHPVRRSHWQFEAVLPALPAGDYRLYADVTHETGFSQTLTALARVPEATSATASDGTMPPADADDSWFAGSTAAGKSEYDLGHGRVMKWERVEPIIAGREASLRFVVLGRDGSLTRLEPYMSMLGHAAIRRDDGAVFTHLHPAGSLSMAAQQVFQLRAGDKPPKRITPEMMEQLCQPPNGDLPQQPLSFPYVFPKPGRYRIWVQIKAGGQVQTGVFDAEVLAGQ